MGLHLSIEILSSAQQRRADVIRANFSRSRPYNIADTCARIYVHKRNINSSSHLLEILCIPKLADWPEYRSPKSVHMWACGWIERIIRHLFAIIFRLIAARRWEVDVNLKVTLIKAQCMYSGTRLFAGGGRRGSEVYADVKVGIVQLRVAWELSDSKIRFEM